MKIRNFLDRFANKKLMTWFRDTNSQWKITAISAFWRDIEQPETTLQTSPVLGGSYAIRINNTVVKTGDFINVLFQPALPYLNGYESLEDIENTMIVGGVVTRADTGILPPDNYHDIYTNRLQDIEFKVTLTKPFTDFHNFDLVKMDDQHWGEDFYKKNAYSSAWRIGEYILCRWSSDSYVSEECILRSYNTGFQLLFFTGYQFGSADVVSAGNLRPPERFTKWLSNQLLEMGD